MFRKMSARILATAAMLIFVFSYPMQLHAQTEPLHTSTSTQIPASSHAGSQWQRATISSPTATHSATATTTATATATVTSTAAQTSATDTAGTTQSTVAATETTAVTVTAPAVISTTPATITPATVTSEPTITIAENAVNVQPQQNLETSGFQINATATYEEMTEAIDNGTFKIDQPIYLVSDNMRNSTEDMNYLNQIKTKLEAAGAQVTVMDIGPSANLKVYDVAPENAVVVSLGGVDAAKIHEFGETWFKNLRDDNELLFVNLGKKDLSTNPTLQRAHDDNYSPSSFSSLEDPLSYLIENNVQLNQSDLNWIYRKDSTVDGVSDIAAQTLQMAGTMVSPTVTATAPTTTTYEGFSTTPASTDTNIITGTSITEVAQSITANYTSAAAKAQAVFDFVQDNVAYEGYSGTKYGAEGTLQAGKGNGYDQALLTGALCKAVGLDVQYKEVSATNVRGMGIDRDSAKRIYTEAKVDGIWKAIDTADKRNAKVGDLNITVTNIAATYSSLGSAAAVATATNTTAQTTTTATTLQTTTQTTSNNTATVADASKDPQYLKTTTNCQVNDAAIQKKAKEITAGCTTDQEKAQAIFNYVNSNTHWTEYYNSQYGAKGTLNLIASSGTAYTNCCDQANLQVALARAAGLEARYAHNYNCVFSDGTWPHVWAQVRINGAWTDADTVSSMSSEKLGHPAFTANSASTKYYVSLEF